MNSPWLKSKEGDLIIGKGGFTAMATMVKRKSRLTLLIKVAESDHPRSCRMCCTSTTGHRSGREIHHQGSGRGTRRPHRTGQTQPVRRCSSRMLTRHGNVAATRTRTVALVAVIPKEQALTSTPPNFEQHSNDSTTTQCLYYQELIRRKCTLQRSICNRDFISA